MFLFLLPQKRLNKIQLQPKQNKQNLNYLHNSLQDKFKNQLQNYKNKQSSNSPNLKQQIKKEVNIEAFLFDKEN